MKFQDAAALCLLLAAAPAALAKPWWMRGIDSNSTDFLPPDAAFRIGAHLDGQRIVVRWVIAEGYYLYKQKLEFKAESPDLLVSVAELPPGTIRTDQFLGTQEIYRQQIEARLAFERLDRGAHPVQVKVSYQGCADAGLCYPPISRVLFPSPAADVPPAPATRSRPVNPYELSGMLGGGLAFLLAGWAMRRARRLERRPRLEWPPA